MKGDIFCGLRHAPGAPAAAGLPGLRFPAGKFKPSVSVGCACGKELQPHGGGGLGPCGGGPGGDLKGVPARGRLGARGARHPLLSPRALGRGWPGRAPGAAPAPDGAARAGVPSAGGAAGKGDPLRGLVGNREVLPVGRS